MLPNLSGKTVLIVGNAPDVTYSTVDSVTRDYTIAASSAVKHCLNADMVVSIDGVIPAHEPLDTFDSFAYFAGLIVTGVQTDDPRALRHNIKYERVNGVDFRNNGLAAIRIAVECGAKRIVLVGFSPELYDAFNAEYGYDGLVSGGLAAIKIELGERIAHHAAQVDTPAVSVKRSGRK